MQLSHVFLVLSAAAATIATPVASPEQQAVEMTEQQLFESIAAKYNIDLSEPDEIEVRDVGLESRALNCYGRGPTWSPDSNNALDRAGRWCSGNGGSGHFRAGQLKGGCYNVNNNKYWAFHVQNNQDREISLSSGACFRFLRGVINSCSRGGTNDNGPWNWRYVFSLKAKCR